MDDKMNKNPENINAEEQVIEFNEAEKAAVPQDAKKEKRKKRRKGLFIFFVVFMSIILVAVGTVTAFVFSKLGKIKYVEPEQTTIDTNQEFIEEEEDKIKFVQAEVAMIPQNKIQLPADKIDTFLKMIDALEDNDDVQNVYHNVEIPDDEE